MRDSVDGSTQDAKLRVNQPEWLFVNCSNVGHDSVPYNALHQMIGHFSRNNMHIKLWQVVNKEKKWTLVTSAKICVLPLKWLNKCER